MKQVFDEKGFFILRSLFSTEEVNLTFQKLPLDFFFSPWWPIPFYDLYLCSCLDSVVNYDAGQQIAVLLQLKWRDKAARLWQAITICSPLYFSVHMISDHAQMHSGRMATNEEPRWILSACKAPVFLIQQNTSFIKKVCLWNYAGDDIADMVSRWSQSKLLIQT